ncbi:uncharacterized protein LOC116400801 isoform X2 [Anarrhichthys ocellatus]|uniref:uncharacterized protein LOC116400801 isoform X2 n=1 Tax=Anarrhichthys ocellatus TaxID=433405 RepID=UPI0012EE1010|nr:uncharacterized protein LOC116400801 isoform X2 [Anarrhichthys ocellatus]
MMAGVTRILTFICVAGYHLSSASPVLRSALVVPAGGNVSLACNLTSSSEITWYLLRSDQLLPLLTVAPTKLKDVTINFHTADDRRFNNRGDPEGGPVRLEIQQVEEKDAGLYFCTGRCEGAVCVNRGIHLAVDGVDGEPSRQPCWSLGICVLPALLVLCLVFIVGLCLRSGKAAVGCCDADTSQRVTEEESLHYSSLKHADKPRPSGRGGTGLVEDDVTYSAVMSRKNPNASRDRR